MCWNFSAGFLDFSKLPWNMTVKIGAFWWSEKMVKDSYFAILNSVFEILIPK